jgi:hypothetical protein
MSRNFRLILVPVIILASLACGLITNPSSIAQILVSPTPIVTRTVAVKVTSAVPTSEPPTATNISATLTPQATADLGVSVTVTHETTGYYLIVKGGPENYDKRYGPAAQGEFVISANGKFAMYVDIVGNVYIAPFDKSGLQLVKKINKKDFAALNRDETPNWDLGLHTDNNGTYYLDIEELTYSQKSFYLIPRNFTQ